MSWLSKGLKKVGKVAEKAAPFVGMIPGVGTIAGGAIGGLGALAAGDGLGGALKYGAMGAAGGAGGAALRSLGTGGKVLAAGKAVLGGGPAQAPGMPKPIDVGSIVNHSGVMDSIGGTGAPGEAPSGGGWMDGLKKVGGGAMDFLGQHGDQLLGGAALGEGYLNQRKANNLSNEALKLSRQNYADRAGLRKLGVSQMMDQAPPDLSAQFADPNNPYSKLRKVG